jgi:hypothetical protein
MGSDAVQTGRQIRTRWRKLISPFCRRNLKIFLRNAGKYRPNYTASRSTMPRSYHTESSEPERLSSEIEQTHASVQRHWCRCRPTCAHKNLIITVSEFKTTCRMFPDYRKQNDKHNMNNGRQCNPAVYYNREGEEDTNFTESKTKLHGLSPRANYTDRATAACRRSDCQLLRIKGATWSAW